MDLQMPQAVLDGTLKLSTSWHLFKRFPDSQTMFELLWKHT